MKKFIKASWSFEPKYPERGNSQYRQWSKRLPPSLKEYNIVLSIDDSRFYCAFKIYGETKESVRNKVRTLKWYLRTIAKNITVFFEMWGESI